MFLGLASSFSVNAGGISEETGISGNEPSEQVDASKEIQVSLHKISMLPQTSYWMKGQWVAFNPSA